ncbi:hypothetical protein GCM10023405_27720 [Streptomonospora salina]
MRRIGEDPANESLDVRAPQRSRTELRHMRGANAVRTHTREPIRAWVDAERPGFLHIPVGRSLAAADTNPWPYAIRTGPHPR